MSEGPRGKQLAGGGWGELLSTSPPEALVGVVDEGEGGDDQLAGHAAELPAESFHVLADALVPGTNNTERLDQGAGQRVERVETDSGYLLF